MPAKQTNVERVAVPYTLCYYPEHCVYLSSIIAGGHAVRNSGPAPIVYGTAILGVRSLTGRPGGKVDCTTQ